MKAVGMLMVEHRLIERMVKLMEKELGNEELKHSANPVFIYDAVDFFKNYADRIHHGKEEAILFAELEKKPLTPGHRKIMDDLIAEHKVARENTKGLLEAAQRYDKGDMDAIMHIMAHLKRLVALYPPHIMKEDREFFFPVMEYFSEEEKSAMLAAFEEFDRKALQEIYGKAVAKYEG
jgi:hemerythrin-like domain-containing protein